MMVLARFIIFLICLIFILYLILYSDIFSISHPLNLQILKSSYQIYPAATELNKLELKADNPNVVNTLKKKFLFPPSLKPYNLTYPELLNPSMGQAQVIDRILNYMRGGFFIECGALDGETRSNTLFFERERNWKGILIEADPKNFEQILDKHRKAFSSPTCLAPAQVPISVKFQQQNNMGHIVGKLFNNVGGPELGSVLEVQCFPLVSYLKALNVSRVDYFSLDVEGAEFDILKSIPWDQVDIRTLSVEFIHNVNKSAIEEFMVKRDYFVHSEVTHPHWLANDFIFVKNDMLNQLNSLPYPYFRS